MAVSCSGDGSAPAGLQLVLWLWPVRPSDREVVRETMRDRFVPSLEGYLMVETTLLYKAR